MHAYNWFNVRTPTWLIGPLVHTRTNSVNRMKGKAKEQENQTGEDCAWAREREREREREMHVLCVCTHTDTHTRINWKGRVFVSFKSLSALPLFIYITWYERCWRMGGADLRQVLSTYSHLFFPSALPFCGWVCVMCVRNLYVSSKTQTSRGCKIDVD